jgi:hypothetical protein
MNPQRNRSSRSAYLLTIVKLSIAAVLAVIVAVGPVPQNRLSSGFVPTASANSTYANLASGTFTFNLTAANADLISSNDDWSAVPSVEGYFGEGLTGTHGVDPQTVLGTEFPGNALPSSPTQVNANKGNPNAYNAGGVTEFDTGTYISLAFQGNTQANPYIVFYLNATNRANVTVSYEVTDIDGGSNNAVSPVALQYRVGNTGLFTNLPAGYIADATDGPNIDGRVTTRTVVLPSNASNQPIVQVRLVTTNAANTSGNSTPDEWIGVNNVSISSFAPSAANVEVGGRVMSAGGGRAVSGAVVTLIDEFGDSHTAITNPFGYYNFEGLRAASTVIISVSSKRYAFDTQVVTLFDSLSDVDFIAVE